MSSPQPPSHLPYVEISLDALLHNLAQIRSRLTTDQGVMAVVKDCAYGLGAAPVSAALEKAGVAFFAVAKTVEARALREAGITSPLLILGECDNDEIRWASKNAVRLTLNDLSTIEQWRSAGCAVQAHINIDTGMRRMGLAPHEIPLLVAALKSVSAVRVEGLFTHFACADAPATATVDEQRRAFAAARKTLAENGITPACVHTENSATLARLHTAETHLVRPGIALYGCNPDPAQDFGLALKQVASLKSHIVKIKQVPAGTAVSYGGRYLTSQATSIATIPLGYAHGLPRSLGNRGDVLVRGKRYRIAGTVTMDYIMIDAGPSAELAVGDEVVAIGCQGNDCVSADEVARNCSTISYEILCGLNTCIDRFYYQDNRCVLHQPGRSY
jgi:alanine racemase